MINQKSNNFICFIKCVPYLISLILEKSVIHYGFKFQIVEPLGLPKVH